MLRDSTVSHVIREKSSGGEETMNKERREKGTGKRKRVPRTMLGSTITSSMTRRATSVHHDRGLETVEYPTKPMHQENAFSLLKLNENGIE